MMTKLLTIHFKHGQKLELQYGNIELIKRASTKFSQLLQLDKETYELKMPSTVTSQNVKKLDTLEKSFFEKHTLPCMKLNFDMCTQRLFLYLGMEKTGYKKSKQTLYTKLAAFELSELKTLAYHAQVLDIDPPGNRMLRERNKDKKNGFISESLHAICCKKIDQRKKLEQKKEVSTSRSPKQLLLELFLSIHR